MKMLTSAFVSGNCLPDEDVMLANVIKNSGSQLFVFREQCAMNLSPDGDPLDDDLEIELSLDATIANIQMHCGTLQGIFCASCYRKPIASFVRLSI